MFIITIFKRYMIIYRYYFKVKYTTLRKLKKEYRKLNIRFFRMIIIILFNMIIQIDIILKFKTKSYNKAIVIYKKVIKKLF